MIGALVVDLELAAHATRVFVQVELPQQAPTVVGVPRRALIRQRARNILPRSGAVVSNAHSLTPPERFEVNERARNFRGNIVGVERGQKQCDGSDHQEQTQNNNTLSQYLTATCYDREEGTYVSARR